MPPRARRFTVRWKIAALTAAIGCFIAVTIGVIVHSWTVKDIRARAEAQALSDLRTAMDIYRRTGTLPDNANLNMPDMPRELRRPADGTSHTFYEDPGYLGPQYWAAQRVGGPHSSVMTVTANVRLSLQQLRQLDLTMAVASAVSLTLALPLALYGADLIGRRLRRTSRTAVLISAGDLDARTGSTRGNDEVSDLARAVDTMADDLARRLRDERRFTADVAHELRTPVTGLLSAMDLLSAGRTEDLIRARVRTLRDLVEDLLEISRLDAGAETAIRTPVPLGTVVADAIARTGHRARLRLLPAEPATGPVVETDPRRLERVITNLVANAHRHGTAPVEVTIEATDDGATITVRDHGPGYPEDLLAEGPSRFRTGAAERGSHGLGLTIALGHTQVLGGTLTLANAPDGGANATLRLPG
ncbi:HAMP domain-containing histidine kinase [Streptomyces sp. 4503]|uniref:histidine kinase n=1 Tax=Streptomyces niphimycinicus TaxID=2842201 RepID=A0ABS6CHK4_9ACTN|nr:HAMP domain-containing histidine kinase [Streptomyces niphimycinicus]